MSVLVESCLPAAFRMFHVASLRRHIHRDLGTGHFRLQLAGPSETGPCAVNRHNAADATEASGFSSSESRGYLPRVILVTLHQEFAEELTRRKVLECRKLFPSRPGALPDRRSLCRGHRRPSTARIHYCRDSYARRVRSLTSSHTRFYATTINCRGATA